jgi:sugar O-acyltransferase (sialic acid O-acetyltransferase NeuD family)
MFYNHDGTRSKLVIFGTGAIGKLAYQYFTIDSDYDVCAFCVDTEFYDHDMLFSIPILNFDKICIEYPPEEYDMFIAIGYFDMNALRKRKYTEAKAKGYNLASYISSRAFILNGGKFGDNCFVMENAVVQPYAAIGNDVILWSGCIVTHEAVIHDHCFLAAGSVIAGKSVLEQECFVGLNAIIRNGLHIGSRCLIGAGSIMLNDAEPDGVYGVPGAVRAPFTSTDAQKYINI